MSSKRLWERYIAEKLGFKYFSTKMNLYFDIHVLKIYFHLKGRFIKKRTERENDHITSCFIPQITAVAGVELSEARNQEPGVSSRPGPSFVTFPDIGRALDGSGASKT